jgi:hypothetical protein
MTATGWIATDFVDMTNELVCHKERMDCGRHPVTYRAQCENGVTVVDVFAHDDTLKQTNGAIVSVPEACGMQDGVNTMCHYRFVVQCTPCYIKKDVYIRRTKRE